MNNKTIYIAVTGDSSKIDELSLLVENDLVTAVCGVPTFPAQLVNENNVLPIERQRINKKHEQSESIE